MDTMEYRRAVNGEGDLAAQWKDKPHRLIYDLAAEVDRLGEGADALRCELVRSATALCLDPDAWKVGHLGRAGAGAFNDLLCSARDFLLREFKGAESKPLGLDLDAPIGISPEQLEKVKQTLRDLSRDRREGTFSDPDFRVPAGEAK